MEIEDEAATVAATAASVTPRIEIVAERRRAHAADFRMQVLAEARTPGTQVRDLARRHEICSSLIYRWRREAVGLVDAAPPARLAPVRVAARAFGAKPPRSTTTPVASLQSDQIEIELRNGVRIRIAG